MFPLANLPFKYRRPMPYQMLLFVKVELLGLKIIEQKTFIDLQLELRKSAYMINIL
jgi:hypothetical protein